MRNRSTLDQSRTATGSSHISGPTSSSGWRELKPRSRSPHNRSFRVERADAAEWLEKRLAVGGATGRTRVVFHSAVWGYLTRRHQRPAEDDDPERRRPRDRRCADRMAERRARSTSTAPPPYGRRSGLTGRRTISAARTIMAAGRNGRAHKTRTGQEGPSAFTRTSREA